MARIRDIVLLTSLLLGASAAPGMAGPSPAGEAPLRLAQYYQQERPYYGRPPPRRVCWTENRRVFAGRDTWGRPIYRYVPHRVCGYR